MKKLVLKGEYCADFETTSKVQYLKEGRTKVYLYKIVSLRTGKGWYGLSINDFFAKISTNKDIKKVYFHNLSFDGTFITYYLLEKKFKWIQDSKNVINLDYSFTTIIDEFGSIYKIVVNLGNEHIVNFQCSYKLIGLSIKDLGTLVGLNKLNETHNYAEIKNFKSIEDVTKEELSYIDNDVEIMRQGIIKCYEMGIKGLTKSSACYNIRKRMSWGKYKNIPSQNEEVNKIINASYRGGIVIMNPLYEGKILKELRDYDVNSLYPSVMYNDMPSGEEKVYKNEIDIPKQYTMRLYEVVVKTANIREGFIPFIPTRKGFLFKDSYEYPNSFINKVLYIRKDEFNLFKRYYEGEWEVIKIVARKPVKDLFTEYIDTFRTIKENAPNPSPERSFAKVCMNGLYGKFAQTSDRISKRPYLNEEKELVFEKYESELGSGYDRKISSKITSDARCVLIRAIEKDPSRFIYCDTDSLYVLGDYEYDIPIDDKKFGYRKYENSYYEFKGLKAKCYISTIKPSREIHSAVAGLPKQLQETLTFGTFKEGLTIKNAKNVFKRVKGGAIIDTTDFTIKIRKDDILNSGDPRGEV